jgi:hypothetical protein
VPAAAATLAAIEHVLKAGVEFISENGWELA